MKFLKLSLIGLIAMFLITSCEDDPIGGGGGGGGTDEGPSLVFVEQAGSLSADSKVDPETIFTVTLQAGIGSADLNSLEIQQDGVRLEDFANRLTIAGSIAPSSAVLIPESNATGFTWDITIKAQADKRKSIYKFIVTDDNSNTASTDIEIDTESEGSGTAEPSIQLNGNSNVIAPANSIVCFPLEVLAGDNAIESITILDANADPIPAARCYFGGTTVDDQFTANPDFLDATSQQGFTEQVYIRAQDDESEQGYIIAISDGLLDPVFIEVTINTFPGGVSGNPLDALTGVLFNRAGPAGKGGLDLDSGASTGSSDAAAEIKDNGIDVNQSSANNWIQRISGVNGTILKQLVPNSNGLAEDFTFDGVTVDNQLSAIWGNGTDFTGVNAMGEAWSEVVAVGDMFIAQNANGKYYIMQVTEINVDPNNNEDDFYRMDIKL